MPPKKRNESTHKQDTQSGAESSPQAEPDREARLQKEYDALIEELNGLRTKQEYMTYLAKRTQKRQNAIITLSDQNRKELEQLKREKEEMVENYNRQAEELKKEILKRESELALLNTEIAGLTEFKSLQQQQLSRIAELEQEVFTLKCSHSECLRRLRADFLAERARYEEEAKDKIQALTLKAKQDVAHYLITHTQEIHQENQRLCEELQYLIERSQSLHKRQQKLQTQHQQLLTEREYVKDLRRLRTSMLSHKSPQEGANIEKTHNEAATKSSREFMSYNNIFTDLARTEQRGTKLCHAIREAKQRYAQKSRLLHSKGADQLQVVGPDGPLVVEAGEDLILPCSLKPNISAVDMTVEWYRLHTSDSLVHLYKDGVENNEKQIQSYRGRTSLFKEELQKGNTSLKLSRVKVSDEGKYKCYIQTEDWSDDVTVQVNVEAVGTHPVISMEGYSIGKGLSLLCEIKGWNPEPEVLWLDSDGNLLPAEDTETLRDTEKFHVKKRVTVQDSNTNRFYCRVILSDHMRETEIVISIKSLQQQQLSRIAELEQEVFTLKCSHSECLRRLRADFLAERARYEEEAKDKIQALTLKARQLLEPTLQQSGFNGKTEFNRTQRKYAVDVTLDPDTANPYFVLSDDGKQVRYGDTRQNLPDNPKRFDCWLSVLGKEGFSSGRFYYEVQVSGKTEWILGVVRESVNRKGFITQCPENGHWTVGRKGNQYKARDDPSVLLSLKQNPQKVGVFVDYEEGLVSFYDVETMSHIYSFACQSFTEKLYPCFNPCDNETGKNLDPLVITSVNHSE
ncbi:butyrophilin subfamily 1 member A1 [Chanos chanos]|uniref:Butyrophilin subfamily 1 member A1 n=1 Tax=Chanos chanos TaxID=29144 RepID=A0A6J2VST0_CHACN|nr:butyrophilin subfamily 1 member A1-like [Chanos chanos]